MAVLSNTYNDANGGNTATVNGTLVPASTTGSGALVLSQSPALVTPALGVPASGDLRNCTFPVQVLPTNAYIVAMSIAMGGLI